jgi:hypothetical protein
MDLDKVTIVGVYGDRNSGKSNLGVYLLRQYKGKRKIYVLGYPKKIDDFQTLANKTKILQIKNSIIFLDEFTAVFPTNGGHTNQTFTEIARKLRHYNNTIIFTTQQTQDLTKSMEGFVDAFCITKISNMKSIKNGSKIKDILDDLVDYRKTPYSFNLEPGQYYEYAECHVGPEDRILEFPFQNIGKDWVNITEKQLACELASTDAFELACELAHSEIVKPNISLTLQEIETETRKEEKKHVSRNEQSK